MSFLKVSQSTMKGILNRRRYKVIYLVFYSLLVGLLFLAQQQQQHCVVGLATTPSSPTRKLPHIPILYETEKLLVIDKPHGISHHDKAGVDGGDDRRDQESSRRTTTTPTTSCSNEMGVLSVLRHEYPHLKDQLYGVHRLDQVTSGLLVIAKSPAVARVLTQAFTDRHVVKYYTGLSAKTPKKKKQGWVNGYMRRGRRKSWYLTKGDSVHENYANHDATTAATEVWAKTYFWTAGLGNLASAYCGPNGELDQETVLPRTLILFRPYTGRTHQLRVASKSAGIPLLGDPLYTTNTANDPSPSAPFPRTCLHATGLHIPKEYLAEAGIKDDLTVWSPPPFMEWWDSGNRPDLRRLLQKDPSLPDCMLNEPHPNARL